MGKRKVLLPAAMLLSALSALAGMLPYILIWLIVRELLEYGEIPSSGNVVTYAWWAAGMAVASIVLYFAALMSSHLAAFRVESNLRKEAMRQIVRMPLGFFDINTSGRIRKIIDDNAGVTHSFLAHQSILFKGQHQCQNGSIFSRSLFSLRWRKIALRPLLYSSHRN